MHATVDQRSTRSDRLATTWNGTRSEQLDNSPSDDFCFSGVWARYELELPTVVLDRLSLRLCGIHWLRSIKRGERSHRRGIMIPMPPPPDPAAQASARAASGRHARARYHRVCPPPAPR